MAMLITDSALWPSPRVSVTAIASAQKLAQSQCDRGEHHAGARPIQHAADADGEAGPDEGRPKVQLRVVNASNPHEQPGR